LQTLRKFHLNPGPHSSLSSFTLLLSLPPLFCPIEGQRPPAIWPAMPAGKPCQRAMPRQAPIGPQPNRLPLTRIHPCPTRAYHAAVDSRWPSHEAPATPRFPLLCRAQLHLPSPFLPRVPIKGHPSPCLHAHPSSHGCHCHRRAPPRRTRPSGPPPPELASELVPLKPPNLSGLAPYAQPHQTTTAHHRCCRRQGCRDQPSSS
jgi:hypothetical protein